MAHPALAAFSRAACWRNDCIQRNSHNILCFYPSPDPDPKGHIECTDTALRRVLDVHIDFRSRSALSTAYYDTETLKVLGGSDWHVPDRPTTNNGATAAIAACHTGLVNGTVFYTTCHFVDKDDDFTLGYGACGRVHGHDERVLREQCCGWPRNICPPSQDPLWRHMVANAWIQWLFLTTMAALSFAVIFSRAR
ncbi:hypothetical protein BKA62DRAFT_771528 [Auriculariales sp. MPI-PUGE-AT-0066]|nr:hypothetical protein BKA62DRAFT_771528 [Auriculariales sp. MPI-PUGE-AT-0066]